MSDPVGQYLAKYGQAASDPVASYLSRYRSTTTHLTVPRAAADVTAVRPTESRTAPEAGNVVFGAMQAIPQLVPGTAQFAADLARTGVQAVSGLLTGRPEQFAQAGQSAVGLGRSFLEPVADVAVLPFQVAAGHLTDEERQERLQQAGGTLMSLLALEGGGRLLPRARVPVEPLRVMTDAELAQHPLGRTPPFAESAASPAVLEAQVRAAAARMLRTSDTPSLDAILPSERGAIRATPDALEARVDLATLPEHSRAIQQQISVGERARTPIGLRDIYARLVRRVAPIEHAVQQLTGGEKIPLSRDPGAAAILASGSGARVESFLEHGPFRLLPDGNMELTGTPSYQAILAPLQGKLNAYRRYEVAARSLELAGQPTPRATGIPVEAALAEVAGVDPAVKVAHDLSVQYRRDVLQYWQEAGGVSEAAVTAMKALSDEYVPFQRVFEGKDAPPPVGRVGRVAQQVRRLLGSERRIIDPIESTVDQTRRMIRAADLQRVGSQLVELAEAYPENAMGLLEKVASGPRSPSPGVTLQQPLSPEAVRLHKAATSRGIEMTEEVAGELAAHLSENALTIKDGTIRVFRNGQAETWRVAPELAKGLQAMSPLQLAWWVRLLGFPARGLKTGITVNPAWPPFNMVRDTFDATLQSRYGFRLGIDSFKGFWESVKHGKFRQEFYQGGAAYSGIVGGTRRTTQQTAKRIVPQSVARKVARTIFSPVQALKLFARPFEEAARLGEFMKARQAGASVIEASLAARRVTTDFQMIGSDVQSLAHMTAFFNPAVQSLDTAVRVAATNPARLLAMGTAAISIPSLLLWLANRNDQDIQDLRKTQGGLLYWFLRTPNGDIVRVPKPFLWGQVFGTGMESALDQAFTDDPAAIERFGAGVWSQVGSNVIPNAVQTYFALKDNKDPFFRTPIVPEALTNVEPQYQATEFTTTLARHVGETLKISPARFEFGVRYLTGTLGMDALKGASNVVDRLTGDSHIEPTPVKADWPIIGRFFARSPSSAVEPIRTFYDNARKYSQITATISFLRAKKPAELAAYVEAHQTDLAIAGVYEAGRAELSGLRHQVERIRAMAGVSPADKRAMIDETLRQMASVARQFNQAVAATEAATAKP